MQVAKLFASLGFKVDLTEYNLFEQKLKAVRKETRSYAASLKTIRTRLNNVSTALDGVNKKLDASKVKSSNQRIAASANRLANAVEKSAKGLSEVSTHGQRVHLVIGQINQVLGRGVSGWKHYNRELNEAKSKLGLISAAVRAIPSNKTINVTQRNVGRGSGTGGSGGSTGQGASGAATAGGLTVLGTGVKDFFRSMSPATAVAGGLVTAGFATKEVVQQGREMKKMEIIMKSATEGTDHFTESMKYVRKEANRLGQDVYEMGMGFAKMQQATKGKLNWEDRKTLFTGMAELSTTYGLSQDDQKGVWRALTQMFTKGKIEAEEEGQLAERGLPAKEMIKAATKLAYEKQGKQFNDTIYNKLRQAGGLKMQDIAPELGKIAGDIANKNGALDEALKTSLVGQMRMKNAIREASKDIMDSGLDKLLFELFDKIKNLVPIIRDFLIIIVDVVKGIFQLVKAIKWFVTEHPAAAAAIGALIVLLRVFRFGMWGAASASLLMAGNFKKAMVAMGVAARRFLPFAALYAFYKFGESYNDYLKGKDNWITTFGLLFEIMFLKVEEYLLRIQIGWYQMKRNITSNPLKLFDLNSASVNTLMNGVSLFSKLQSSSNINSGIDKIASDSVNRNTAGTPYGKQPLNVNNDIYIEGNLVARQTKSYNINNFGAFPTT